MWVSAKKIPTCELSTAHLFHVDAIEKNSKEV
jgi:hypothetical protein